ncbi:MAG: NAD-dependent epimerase/dehydratase family protein [Ignavibacteriales bacterium]
MRIVGKTAIVFGASGLVGSELLRLLLVSETYSKVIAFVRKRLPDNDAKLTQVILADFSRLNEYMSHLQADEVYVCLGTTIRKAGSQAAFRQVDLQYPVTIAQAAKQAGVPKLLMITAMGANSQSRIFYNRVKGEVEEQVKAVGLQTLCVFRPSLLMGNRSERRPGEEAGAALSKIIAGIMVGPLRKYRAIPAAVVAKAMFCVAQQDITGVHVFPSDRIAEIGS